METVSFAGTGAWEGPLTWGQRAFRDNQRRHDRTGWNDSVTHRWPVPPGTTLPGVLASIGSLVSRFESLRTLFTDTQRVLDRGEFGVRVGPSVETPVLEGLPCAAAVETERGVPTHVIWTLSYLAVDATSVQVLRDALHGDAPLQPRNLVDLENGPRHQTLSTRAVSAWSAFASADLPFAEPRPTSSGCVQAAMSVPGSWLDTLSSRYGMTSSSVLLAAVAVAIGGPAVPLQVVSSNRHLPDTKDYVGVLAQPGPLLVDATGSFEEVVRRVQRRATTAYRSALWSPSALAEAVGNEVLASSWTFNDARGIGPGEVGSSGLRPLSSWAYQGGCGALAVTGGSGGVDVAMRLDTRYADPDLLPATLEAVRDVLRDAVGEGTFTAPGA